MAGPTHTNRVADLTIVIVSWNTCRLLRQCLASLPAAVGRLAVRTMVVDNASADGSADLVRSGFSHVELIEAGANLGFSAGNNLALRSVESRAVLLLNPDTVCTPGSLESLYEHLVATPELAAVGPTLVDAGGRPTASFGFFPRLAVHFWNILDPGHRWRPRHLRGVGLGCTPDAAATDAFPVEYLKGACLMIDTAALRQVGGLDERFFMYFEETDWCRRARDAGWRLEMVPQISVAHLEGAAVARASGFSLAQFQKSYRLYLSKHHGSHVIWRYRALQYLEYTSKGLFRLLAPWRQRNRVLAADYLAIAGWQTQRSIDIDPPGHAPDGSGS